MKTLETKGPLIFCERNLDPVRPEEAACLRGRPALAPTLNMFCVCFFLASDV